VPAVGGEDGSSADDGYGAMAREKTDVVTKKLEGLLFTCKTLIVALSEEKLINRNRRKNMSNNNI
jgi:hypothetical protein